MRVPMRVRTCRLVSPVRFQRTLLSAPARFFNHGRFPNVFCNGMGVLDRVTYLHGRLSDFRATWWPFVFLKPASSAEPITQRRIFAMTPCFAAWFLVVWALKEWLFGDRPLPPAGDLAVAYGYFLAGFFAWFNAVTAPLWNRRARLEQAQPADGCGKAGGAAQEIRKNQ